ncbi:MAG TPA: DUF4055 domain-containing protein [Nitrospira sp.]|nr:DUF4055 domain-containing protein [Nitrospira sp.]
MSAIDSRHPRYSEWMLVWQKLRDFYEGEERVKDQGELYLHPTEGMILDGMKGQGEAKQLGLKRYEAYKARAVVPEYVETAVELLLGLLHQKPATIKLPPEMEPLRTICSANRESLDQFQRRINVEQLITGRFGIMCDIAKDATPTDLPYMALYSTERIINWDDNDEMAGPNALNLVVLDESKLVRVDFEWKFMNAKRVLQLGPILTNEANDAGFVYKQGYFSNADSSSVQYVESEMLAPMYRGRTLQEVPFVIGNTKDLLSKPDKPPLNSLCNTCIAIYQQEADYRQNLHMQSQDTLVVIGGTRNPSTDPGQPDALRVGAGSRIDVDQGGDAKFIGVSSLGLPEQRQAIENDRKRAIIKSGELIQSGTGSQQESGSALRTRFTAQTATLNQIALTGAEAIQYALRLIARWIGADETQVEVIPNLEFVDFGLDGLDFLNLMQAKTLGFPVSYESLHQTAQDRGLTTMDFKSEISQIKTENTTIADIIKPPPPVPPPGAPAPSVPPGIDPTKKTNVPPNPRENPGVPNSKPKGGQ